MTDPLSGKPPELKKPKPSKHQSPVVRLLLTMTRHVLLSGIAVGCAGLFVLLIADSVVMPLLIQSGSSISAPDMLGKPLEDAEKLAENLNLRIQADLTEYNSEYDANTISFQYPFPGTRVKPGRNIRVRVSLGPRPVEMPSVVGKSTRDARLTLNRYGLEIVGYPWVHSDEYVRNIVARQEPEAGTEIPENAEVILYISDGLPETNVVMPRLIELGLSAARDTLLVYGFSLENVITYEEEAPNLLPETVIDQHPDPGTDTNTNTEVNLIISTSP